MAEFETQYQQLSVYDDDDTGEETDNPTEDHLMIHVVPEGNKARWNHIENLDEFFTRVYQYHQRQGFMCMVLEDFLQLLQFVFVVVFSTFLIVCVKYDELFDNVYRNRTSHHKVTLDDTIKTHDECLQSFTSTIIFCLIVAAAFWLFRVLKVIYNVFLYYEIRSFYHTALKITATDLPNLTWHEVQTRILEVQKDQQMCIHKSDLTQLDIYHRILRFKNYTLAMVNKSVLPLKVHVPFVGEYVFLSTGLKYNIEFLLFWGPWSAFENKWHLKEEYKDKSFAKRKQLAETLSQRILWLGIANLALSPLIFLWQILYSFFRYAELVKRQPAFLGSRRWSNYGRQYLRHFNELDHEFNARLNRGYKAADMYLSIFSSPLMSIIAKNVAFFAGSVLAVLVVLTVIDEDVLNVEHVLTIMTIAGVIVTSCKVFIPDEHAVYCPEVLLRNVLAQIHYMPDHWSGNAHTSKVRGEFSLLFQFKAIYLLEELLSPLITPLLLIFKFRGKAGDFVEFFHNFTVDVVGVGDVCSFAQMDIRKHGNPQWTNGEESQASQKEQGEDGKTEMSLMHFHLTNPEWKPPENCSMFLHNVKDHIQRDVVAMSSMQQDLMGGGAFQSMIPSGATGIGLGYASLVSSITGQSAMLSPSVNMSAPFTSGITPKLRGAVSQSEGPLSGSGGGLGSSFHSPSVSMTGPPTLQPISQPHSLIQPPSSLIQPTSTSQRHYDEGQIELMSTDMSFSALYMHDLRTRRARGYYENLDDIRARSLWQRHDTPQATPSSGGTTPMPNIEEQPMEEDNGTKEGENNFV
ncbi:autophagy-related protein 9A-like [Ruditapes philippinarum]|uniref:autophagy-related protein 9A-like n=1 Tax=Ruditapes philippinarum TaxID=129788 RepID=UPI00295BE548|nr:autophagy-related protein 9A-like [Ruditapes philippinarum]